MSPAKFNWPIVGHENIVDFLQNSIRKGMISHAYLFHGPEHIGKRTTAKYFVSSLLCRSKKDIPCKKCIYCQQFFKRIHPDVYWLDVEEGKKNISIDQVRQLQANLSLSSLTGPYKIAIINQAEALTQEASNSLLKTIEEPKGNAVIIMIARRPSLLPETVRSRCRELCFLPASRKTISEFLKRKFGLKGEILADALSLSRGLPGMAARFAEDHQILSIWQREIKRFCVLVKGNLTARFGALEKILIERDPLEILSLWQQVVRDMTLIKFNQGELIHNSFAREELEKLSRNYSREELVDILEETERAKIYISQNVNQRLVLENLLLKF